MPNANGIPSIAPRPCPLRSGLLCPNALYSPLSANNPGLCSATSHLGETLLFLYLPRCRHDCAACDCHKQRLSGGRAIESYLSALMHELGERAARYTGPAIRHVHLSGGVCSLADAGALTELMYRLAEAFPLAGEGSRSVTAEADPQALDADRLALLRGLGVNQIALDVGRIGTRSTQVNSLGITPSQLSRLVDDIRGHSFRSLRLDLAYGHPVFDALTVERSVNALLASTPERITATHYRSVRVSCATTPYLLSTADQRLRCVIQSALEHAGYRRVSRCATDHFCRSDLAESFAEAPEISRVLAFGVSMASRSPWEHRRANPSNLALWQNMHSVTTTTGEPHRR